MRRHRGWVVRLTGLGVSPGIGIGRALVVTRGDANLRFRIPAHRIAGSWRGWTPRARSARAQIDANQGADRRRRRHRARVSVRRAAADARRPDARRSRGRDHPGRAAERRVRADSGPSTKCRRCSTSAEDPYLRERKGDVADIVGRLCMNLRDRRRPDGSLPRHRGTARAGGGRVEPVAGRAARLAAAGGVCHRRRELDVSHRDPRAIAPHARRGGTAARERCHPAGRARRRGRRHQGRSSWIRRPTWWRELEARSQKRRAYERSLDEFGGLPAVTQDGTPIRIEANVELPEEAVARARARRRGHRTLSIGVPARGHRRGRARRGRAIRGLPAAHRGDGRRRA